MRKRMKIRSLILLLVAGFVSTVYSQSNIPKKLLKDINVTVDEFTGITIYTSKKGSCLSIEDTTLYIGLSVVQYDLQPKIKKIYIISGDEREIIEYNEDEFTSTETAKRHISKPATGKFGTSSYKPHEFETRIVYRDVWRAKAINHHDIINAITTNMNGKVKFEGESKVFYLDFSNKDVNVMKGILTLHEHLTQNADKLQGADLAPY